MFSTEYRSILMVPQVTIIIQEETLYCCRIAHRHICHRLATCQQTEESLSDFVMPFRTSVWCLGIGILQLKLGTSVWVSLWTHVTWNSVTRRCVGARIWFYTHLSARRRTRILDIIFPASRFKPRRQSQLIYGEKQDPEYLAGHKPGCVDIKVP